MKIILMNQNMKINYMKITPMKRVMMIIVVGIALAWPVREPLAQTIPGAADGSRIDSRPTEIPPPVQAEGPLGSPLPPVQPAPSGADQIKFTLRQVVIKGNTALSDAELAPLYQPLIGKTVTLDVAWKIASDITNRYRNQGYFLSKAYVPEQMIETGTLSFQVVEGFIEAVDIEGDKNLPPTVQGWIKRIKAARPIKSALIEQAVLDINAISGTSFRAVLQPPISRRGQEGGSRVTLVNTPVSSNGGTVRLNNHGSRYLGPYQVGISYQHAFIPGHMTDFSVLTTPLLKEVASFSVRETMALAPQLSGDMGASYTRSSPGDTLEVQDINSRSHVASAGLSYHWIRQRTEQLSTRVGLDVVTARSDILGAALSHDDIRVIRFDQNYMGTDIGSGVSFINATVSRGLSQLGASGTGDRSLSRSEADPDFTTLRVKATRVQSLSRPVDMIMAIDGQMASGPLYASEEFGYGGPSFGRAYDSSEIVGDEGIAGSIEFRYKTLPVIYDLTFVPSVFYDIGKVWNRDRSGQADVQNASSAGILMDITHPSGVGVKLGVAFPLTKEINNPILGDNGSSPRLSFETTFRF